MHKACARSNHREHVSHFWNIETWEGFYTTTSTFSLAESIINHFLELWLMFVKIKTLINFWQSCNFDSPNLHPSTTIAFVFKIIVSQKVARSKFKLTIFSKGEVLKVKSLCCESATPLLLIPNLFYYKWIIGWKVNDKLGFLCLSLIGHNSFHFNLFIIYKP